MLKRWWVGVKIVLPWNNDSNCRKSAAENLMKLLHTAVDELHYFYSLTCYDTELCKCFFCSLEVKCFNKCPHPVALRTRISLLHIWSICTNVEQTNLWLKDINAWSHSKTTQSRVQFWTLSSLLVSSRRRGPHRGQKWQLLEQLT